MIYPFVEVKTLACQKLQGPCLQATAALCVEDCTLKNYYQQVSHEYFGQNLSIRLRVLDVQDTFTRYLLA